MNASTMTAPPEPDRSASTGSPRQSADEDSGQDRPAPWPESPVDRRGGPSRSSAPSPLQRLIGDTDHFGADIWGQRPLLVSGSGDDHDRPHRAHEFDDVFSLDAVDGLLAGSARLPTVRMVVDGDPLAPARYCTPLRLGGRNLDDVVDPLKVTDRLAEGVTLVMQSLHRTCAPVAAFVRGLQHEISHPVQANAYLTPPSAAGLAEHSDLHDVIAVQLHGSKHWWVDGLGDVTVHPGDVMYIPRETRHRAETATDMSLHLTFGIIRATYRQVVQRLLRAGDPQLDAPLPIGYRHGSGHGAAALEHGLDAALDRVLDLVGSADLADLAATERRRRLSQPPTPGRIASIARVDGLDDDDLICWIAPEPLARAVDGADSCCDHWDGLRSHDPWAPHLERVTVHLGDRTLTLPTTTLPALRELSSGRPVRVGDLPGLDESGRLVLARRLVREGTCVIEPGGDRRFGAPYPR